MDHMEALVKPRTKGFKLNLPITLLDAIKVTASEEGRSVNSQITIMLRRQLSLEKRALRDDLER